MKNQARYVLGLDLGAGSVGWAAVGIKDGKLREVLRAGARVFEAGMEGDIPSGRAESRNKNRRDARQMRRQTDRRRRRLANVFRILQEAGLLPPGDRATLLPDFDRTLYAKYKEVLACAGRPVEALAHVLPYWLRARALDEKLDAHELGRALYHLAQRRGFLSNRKAQKKKEEDEGKVKSGITDLEKSIEQAGTRTLGEYFAGLDPQQARIRNRYTSRAMYESEFRAIWAAQKPHHPDLLTGELESRVHKAMFYQRPLKSAAGLVGRCELEDDQRRAPWALCAAQRFSMMVIV